MPDLTGGSAGSPLLSDKPIEADCDDRLGMAPFADALAYLIADARTDTPLTIAISGRWGAGKSSLARLVTARLTDRRLGSRANVVCWFNAWMHQEATNLGAALASVVARHADRQRPLFHRLLRPLPATLRTPDERFRRTLGLYAVSVCVGIGSLTLAGHEVRELLMALFGSEYKRVSEIGFPLDGAINASVVALVIVAIAISRRVFAVAQQAGDFIQRPADEAARGGLHEVAAQLASLINQACVPPWPLRRPSRRFVIVVDDLDRCRCDSAIALCEVVANLLAHPHVVILLLCDMHSLARSVTTRDGISPDSPVAERRVHVQDYGSRYMQKLVQLELQLPVPRHTDILPLVLAEPDIGDCAPEPAMEPEVEPSVAQAVEPAAGNDGGTDPADPAPAGEPPPPAPPLSPLRQINLPAMRSARGMATVAAGFGMCGVVAFGYLGTDRGATAIWALALMVHAAGYAVVAFSWPALPTSTRLLGLGAFGFAGLAAVHAVVIGDGLSVVLAVLVWAFAFQSFGGEILAAILVFFSGPALIVFGYLARDWGAARIWAVGLAVVGAGFALVWRADRNPIGRSPRPEAEDGRALPWLWVCLAAAVAALMVAWLAGNWIGVVLAVVSFLTSGVGTDVDLVDGNVGRVEEAADVAIAALADSQETRVDEVMGRLREIAGTDRLPETYLTGHALYYITERSPYRALAMQTLEPYLPPTPRGAKRMRNRLRLMLAIAASAGDLNDRTEVAPGLARWVALQERWPDVARAVFDDPSLLGRMEGATDIQELTGVLEAECLTPHSPHLLLTLLHAQPRLSTLVGTFVHFEPRRSAGGAQILGALATV